MRRTFAASHGGGGGSVHFDSNSEGNHHSHHLTVNGGANGGRRAPPRSPLSSVPGEHRLLERHLSAETSFDDSPSRNSTNGLLGPNGSSSRAGSVKVEVHGGGLVSKWGSRKQRNVQSNPLFD